MKNKDKNKIVLFVWAVINFLFLCFLIIPLLSRTMNTIAPFAYYGYNQATENNIEVKSRGTELFTFSNGDVINVSEMPWWYVPLTFIVFFAYSGPILLITIRLFNKLGLKLPFKLKNK